MRQGDFSWVETHKQLVQYLQTKEKSQKELIDLLETVGVSGLTDIETPNGEKQKMGEIDPFTFFRYIYKYKGEKRLIILQNIARKLDLPIPTGDCGLPSAQAQKTWLFPYKYERKNNEIERLWDFFYKAIAHKISDKDFNDILKIKNVGKSSLTEALFYVDPENYLPINSPIKVYLKEKLKIDSSFNSYNEYLQILKKVKEKSKKTFYELSYAGWIYKTENEEKNKELGQKNNTEYWLYSPGEQAKLWDEFFNKGIIGIGWDKLGDLQQYKTKDEIKKAIIEKYEGKGTRRNITAANYDFLNSIKISDVIIVKKGINELLGYGVVKSDYIFDENRTEFKSIRKVEWKKKGNWEIDFSHLHNKILTNITKYSCEDPKYEKYYEKLLAVMENRKIKSNSAIKYPLNVILYGPPGTGKTYNAILRAAEIIEKRKIETYEEASKIYKENLHKKIEFITFHQNYSYEDFIQGIRPDTKNNKQLRFQRKDGIFKKLADEAKKDLENNYVVIIDEINRANISRVFGELITLIEPDKRLGKENALETLLPSGEEFGIPPNLYIIGTMNTADKSIALLDIALRRRFEFVPMYPLYEIPNSNKKIYDADILKKINEQIIKLKGYDFQIGHSYFMSEEPLAERMNKKVIPLLLEYFMNDEQEVKNILFSAGLNVEENSWPLKIKDEND